MQKRAKKNWLQQLVTAVSTEYRKKEQRLITAVSKSRYQQNIQKRAKKDWLQQLVTAVSTEYRKKSKDWLQLSVKAGTNRICKKKKSKETLITAVSTEYTKKSKERLIIAAGNISINSDNNDKQETSIEKSWK